MIAVALGKEANSHRGVLDRTADEVIDWTLPKGERSSNDVLNDIMNRFDFERCGKTCVIGSLQNILFRSETEPYQHLFLAAMYLIVC